MKLEKLFNYGKSTRERETQGINLSLPVKMLVKLFSTNVYIKLSGCTARGKAWGDKLGGERHILNHLRVLQETRQGR